LWTCFASPRASDARCGASRVARGAILARSRSRRALRSASVSRRRPSVAACEPCFALPRPRKPARPPSRACGPPRFATCVARKACGEGGIRTREKSGLGSNSDALGTTQRSRVVPSAQAAESAGHRVETSLALAIEHASAAGEWDIVAQLATELEARRVAVASVVSIDEARTRRSTG
jgi:hypothetical protein